MIDIKSPITGNRTETIYQYPVKKVVDLYKSEVGVDVSRFFDGLESLNLCKCMDTGYSFYYPSSIAGDGMFYEALNSSNGQYYPSWKWEYEQAIIFLKSKFKAQNEIRMLEIGCGEGHFIKAVKDQFPHILSAGLELNESVIQKLTKENFKVFCQNIEDHSKSNSGVYDFVVAFQVLEHIADVKSFIDACLFSLKPGGVLFFGVPNNDSYIFKDDFFHVLNLPPHHMGLWNYDSLANLPKFFNLKTLSIVEEPADMKNLGIYYRIWLKNNLPKFRQILYPLLRFPVKSLLKIFKPKCGHTIVAVYQKA